MAKNDSLPTDDEATRWIKKKFLGRDDDGKVDLDEEGHPTTVAPTAFELRVDEESLSLTWLQYYGAQREVHLPVAAEAVRQSLPSKNLGSPCAFCIGTVKDILSAGITTGQKLRILHDPIEGNEGHAEVRRYPADLGLLQTILANEVFAERHLYSVLMTPGWQP